MSSLNQISRLICILGEHGPDVRGFGSQYRSQSTGRPLERVCGSCGRRWFWNAGTTTDRQGRHDTIGWSAEANPGTEPPPAVTRHRVTFDRATTETVAADVLLPADANPADIPGLLRDAINAGQYQPIESLRQAAVDHQFINQQKAKRI